MTAHEHREYVEGCFRCDLSRDEASWNMNESDDLTFMIAEWDTSITEPRLAHPWCRNLAESILAAGTHAQRNTDYGRE